MGRRGGFWRYGCIEETPEGREADLDLLGGLPEREASRSDTFHRGEPEERDGRGGGVVVVAKPPDKERQQRAAALRAQGPPPILPNCVTHRVSNMKSRR